MNTDGPDKKKGNFLKKDSPLLKNVKVQKYNFAEIRKQAVIYPDNPGYNVFYKRLQNEDTLNKVVTRSGDEMFENLGPGSHQVPVILPRDFTADWLEEKRKAKRRSAHKDVDEDEFEMVLEEEEEERIAREHDTENTGPDTRKSKKKYEETKKKKENEETTKTPMESNVTGSSSEQVEGSTSTLEDLGRPSTGLSQQEDQANPENPIVKIIDDIPDKEQKEESSLSTPLEAMDETQKEDLQQESPQNLTKDQEEALKQEAYAEGFEQGQQQAFQSAKKTVEELVSPLQKGLKDLQTLNKEILSKSQENFLEITSAISEALVNKAIEVDPALFKNLVEKAIEESDKDTDYTVSVHPDILEAMKKLGLQEVSTTWQADPSLQAGEFSLKTGEQSLRSNIREIVQSMLKDIDLNIYDAKDSDENN